MIRPNPRLVVMVWTGAIVWAFTLITAADEISSGQPPRDLVRASLQVNQMVIEAGGPIWGEFSLCNLTADRVTLRVPDVETNLEISSTGYDEVSDGVALPLAHVFSGKRFSALSVTNDQGDLLDNLVQLKPKGPLPLVHLASHGSVGLRLELTQYYGMLRRPGTYTLIWRPYDGYVTSQPVTISVLARRQAVILTDRGSMTMRFYYNEAPNHVRNFVELVERKFYYDKVFHRVIPGGLIQGGCPRGDGRGVRIDGKRLKAEFSDIPFELGTVGMARAGDDPDSASCQFFICLGRQPSFNGQQTAFGYLVKTASFRTLRRLQEVNTGPNDRPLKPVYIRAITLENIPDRDREEPSPWTSGPPSSQPGRSDRARQDGSHFSSSGQDDATGLGMSVVVRPSTTRPAAETGG